MGNKVDDILRVLSDEGQSSLEEGHPEDRGVVPEGMCWRCLNRPVAAGHDLCRACRSFLLGDSDQDPVGVTFTGQARGPVASDVEIQLGQSSYVSDLFDEPAHEIAPVHAEVIPVELCGGLADGATLTVPSARGGGPPPRLFTPVGMDHGVMRTETYHLDEASGPEVWTYRAEVDPLDPCD
jgi:hypothetical protein